MNLEEDNVGAVLLGPTDQIKEGMVVKRTKRIASINAVSYTHLDVYKRQILHFRY